MGLDIYFFVANKKQWNDEIDANATPMGSDTVIFEKEWDDTLLSECAYFRKVNFLVQFFNYEENCSFREVGKCEIELLIDCCKKVLQAKNEDVSSKLLPTTTGFFFGTYEYDEYYYDAVKNVLKTMTTLLTQWNDDETILMHCWW